MRRITLFFSCLSAVILLTAATESSAQLRTIIDSVNVVGFPEVILHLRVMEGDNSVRGMKIQDFTILENGVIVPITGGYCEDTIGRGPVSVLLVIDVSGSMGPPTSAINDAKRAAKSFIDRLSIDDEAALMSFSDDVYFNQNWTNDWPLIKSKIDQLNARGTTMLWDAVLAGTNVIRLRTKKKVMIVLTDGQDKGSQASSSTAIAAAVNTGVIVYTIGLGREIEEDRLRQLAAQTGGKYFHAPDASDLDQIYAEINLALVSTGVCELRYISPIDCWNGDRVQVEVRAATSHGVATGSTSYTLPYDTTTFSYVTLAMQRDYVVEGGERITVPLELARVSVDRAPSLFDFSVNFDTDMLTLVDANVTALSTGYIPTVTPTQLGANIRLAGVSPLTTPGQLLELIFEARPTLVSGKTEISVSPPDVQRFCTVASSVDGLITVSGSCERAIGAKIPGTVRVTLLGASPNPFNPGTRIRYTVSENAHVTLVLSDLLGRRVRTLLSAPVTAGEYDLTVDGTDLPGGMYVVSISADGSVDMRKILLMK